MKSFKTCIKILTDGRAEKGFLAFQNKDSFLVAMNKTSINENILRRRTRAETLYFGRGAISISPKTYISVDISIMALSYRVIFCREFCAMVTKMKKLRIRRRITAS